VQRTTSFTGSQNSGAVNHSSIQKTQSAALSQIVAWGGKNGCEYWLFAKRDRLSIMSQMRHTNGADPHFSRQDWA
jgi:hypothetical protein